MCSLFDVPNRPWRFKGLERITITLMFLGTLVYESGWRKRTETQEKAGCLWVPADWSWVEFQPPGFTVRCWCNSQATLEEAKEERVLGQRAVWSKGHGNHMGQDGTRDIICFFALSVPWHFYFWEQVHEDSQRHWWCPWHLMFLVITSCVHISESRAYSASW